ncbi:MAG: FAD binding domain-containing protein [Desulfobacteraceae bacterium]
MFRNLPRFEYLSPETTEEAFALLAQYGPKTKVIAGGTDLVPQMRWGEIRPEVVLGLGRIPDLQEIQFDHKGGLKLGALCKIGTIESSPIIRENYPILAQAASVLACTEIRNRATVGGNCCTAAPSADMPPSLLVLRARAVIASENGERVVPLEDFFLGPKKTVLDTHELLVRLEMPPIRPNSAGEYIKLGRRNAMEIAMIGVAALITLRPRDNTCEEAKLALATAAPTPIRCKEAEQVLTGKKLDKETIESAAEAASREASPRTSWRSTEAYRRDMIRVLTRRAIQGAMDKIKS